MIYDQKFNQILYENSKNKFSEHGYKVIGMMIIMSIVISLVG